MAVDRGAEKTFSGFRLTRMCRNQYKFCKIVITHDELVEACIYTYNTITKQPYAKCAAKTKVMLTGFFNYKGVVHYKYALQGQTVNQNFYLEMLGCLCNEVQCKWL
jgi:hypothetical protein